MMNNNDADLTAVTAVPGDNDINKMIFSIQTLVKEARRNQLNIVMKHLFSVLAKTKLSLLEFIL